MLRGPAAWSARRRDAVVLGIIAVLMLALLPMPLNADDSLYAVGAKELAHGATYYRDLWDIKQPGIYLWFRLARVFGAGFVGVQVLNLVWTLALSVVLQRGSRGWFRHAWMSSALPLLVAAPYAITARPYSLQVEWLVQLPLAATLVLAAGARQRPVARLALAGLCGGVVLAFKLLLAPLVAIALIMGLVRARRAGARPGALAGAALAAGAAALVAPAGTILPLLAHDSWGLVWRTTTLYPRLVGKLPSQHTGDLLEQMLRRSVRLYSLTLTLGLVGLAGQWHDRRRGAGRRPEGTPVLTAAVLVVAAVLLISVQRWSDYQPYLLIGPVGILSAEGIDRLALRARELTHERGEAGQPGARRSVGQRRARIAVVVAAAVALGAPAAAQAVLLVKATLGHGAGITASGRLGWREEVSPEYADVHSEASAVRTVVPGGSTYIVGNPLYYTELGREQALEINGFIPGQLVGRQWQELTRELLRTRPEVVFVDKVSLPLIREAAPAFVAELVSDYTVVRDSSGISPRRGIWYVRRPGVAGGPAAPHADGAHL
ncbi:MAG TPA: hypothetical protein VHE83_14140 [Mycobacteriales bacterium]|nr:hypothetical protein [Mycobacteriales bacterium]